MNSQTNTVHSWAAFHSAAGAATARSGCGLSPRWLLILCVLAASLLACTRDDGPSGNKKNAPPPAPVLVAKVERRTVPVTVRAIGNVEAIDTVAVKSRIDGEIVAVEVRDGQDVTKGQLLFELDPRFLEAQVRQLEATQKKDEALLSNAESTERRYADLLSKNFISEEAYTQAKANKEAAAATVAADRAAVESAQVQLSYTRMYAPFNGRAGRVTLQLGNTVKANDTISMVVINRVEPIYVTFSIPEQYLPQIRSYGVKSGLEVRAAPQGAAGPGATGRLTFIDNAVDMQTGTIKLRATFPNQDRQLWPGQFVSVILTLREQPDAVVVPPEAVENGPNGQYVFVVKPDMSAEVRNIVVDRNEGSYTVVAKGLEAGEIIITSGQLRVVPGGKVAPKAG